MNEPVTPDDLAAMLKREFETADSYHDQIELLQEAAFRYYEAQPFGNEIEGRSQVVLPDVQETVDYMTQSVLRTFISGDRTVEFEAVNEEDEQAADDATAAIDYNFMRKQDGYGVLNDVIQDGNLRKLGIFKAVRQEMEKVSRRWEVIPAEALPILLEEAEVEDLREFEDETGAAMIRALIKTEKRETQYHLVAVPTQEFRFTPNSRHEDVADYVGHAKPTTRSELVSMGFDREQVYGLPAHVDEVERDSQSNTLDQYVRDENSEALVKVLFCEEYARIDVDGDGIAELVKACRVENEILRYQGERAKDEFDEPAVDESGEPIYEEGELAIETVDEQPFSVFCPFPRPHRLIGYSLADKVMDIQYARSHVARQLFDGMAFANMPRPIVSESGSSEDTLDDILNPIPGSPIRVRSLGAVEAMPNSFDVGKSMSVMEWMTGERESRTGITRLNQGLDADTLNKTATGTALMQAQGQQYEEYVARNLAEAFARGCGKLYRLMRLEAEPFQIKVDGKYRTVDPSSWPEDMNMRVRVGLGTGAKDKRLSARLAVQEPLMLAFQEGLAGPEHLFNWFDGFARDLQLGMGDDFMYDPSDPEVAQKMAEKQEEPDPAVIEAQGKLKLEQAKAEAAAQLQRDKAGADIDTQRAKHELDMQVARERAVLENQLARERTAAEIQLSREKTAAEIEMKRNMTNQRMGGSLAS